MYITSDVHHFLQMDRQTNLIYTNTENQKSTLWFHLQFILNFQLHSKLQGRVAMFNLR